MWVGEKNWSQSETENERWNGKSKRRGNKYEKEIWIRNWLEREREMKAGNEKEKRIKSNKKGEKEGKNSKSG